MRRFAVPLLALALLGGCQSMPYADAPVHGSVSDLSRFDAFIATRPKPDAFRTAYPDVQLVLPGMAVTREYRHDHSRYFAELDWAGRISSGQFM